jgi:hypothetical protein
MSFQVYTPFACDIADIQSVDRLTVITTTVPHGFVLGNLVGFSIPKEYGMTQLSGRKGYVLDLDETTVTITINSIEFQPFMIPTVIPPKVIDPAQILPIGDANSGSSSPGGIPDPSLTIPGAFRAIVV